MKKDSSINPWKTKSVKQVYDNPWIELSHREVLTPGGHNGIYGVVRFKNFAIGILPLDEENNTWIVGQFRYPIDRYTWEIPEGGGALQTPVLDSAKRELVEETGIMAEEWTQIQTMFLSNSATDEYAVLYVARKLSFTEARPDEDEDIVVRKLPFEELYQMVLSGEVDDSLSVTAVLKAKLLMNEGKL
jgi:8-oxo-dGTP pyrophosphatase MutT (NUDIX family)